MEDRSSQTARDRVQMAQGDVTSAIQIIETFVREESWPARIRDAWNRVKGAAFKGVKGAGDQEVAQSLKELQNQMKGLATTVRELAMAPVTKEASYANVLHTGIQLVPQKERKLPVPSRRSREVVIAPGDENPRQSRLGACTRHQRQNPMRRSSGNKASPQRRQSSDF